MANPLKVTSRAVDNLPHFSNSSSQTGLKSILRKARKNASRIVSHGSPVGVSRRKDKAQALFDSAADTQRASSQFAEGLATYKQNVSDVASKMRRTNSGSQAAALYQTSGLANRVPSISKGTFDPKRSEREAMNKLLKTRGGQRSVNAFSQHEQGTTQRLVADVQKNQRQALRQRRHAQAQSRLAEDAYENSVRNGVVAGTSAIGGGGAAYALYKRHKQKQNNTSLGESSFTRQKLR